MQCAFPTHFAVLIRSAQTNTMFTIIIITITIKRVEPVGFCRPLFLFQSIASLADG